MLPRGATHVLANDSEVLGDRVVIVVVSTMDPAVLADLVGRVHVDPLAGAKLLDQLAAKLSPMGLVVAFGFQLPQSLARSADHQIAHAHTLAVATQGI